MNKVKTTKERIRQEKQDIVDGKIGPNISFSSAGVKKVRDRLKKDLENGDKK